MGAAMTDGWFSRPVSVTVGIAGEIHHVENAREAMKLLTGNWREQASERYKAAKRACQGALRGEVPGDVARQAFMDAAAEARVLAK